MIRNAIHSFVCRRRRLTPSQQFAWEKLLPRYGISGTGQLDLAALFGRTAKKHLEIGFGMGESLITMAKNQPDFDFLGIEVHHPGICQVLLQLEALQLTNVRLLHGDAVAILQDNFLMDSLDKVYILFPDPWPKHRHHKRRLIQPAFVQLLAQRLKSGGQLHLATDWEHYAYHMLSVLENAPEFINEITPPGFAPRPSDRPLTKFERRGQRLGHRTWDLMFVRS